MFIQSAWADTAAVTTASVATDSGSILMSMLPILLILAVFYLMVIRPQNRRLQAHRYMIDHLQKGDKVVTAGGLIATVKKTVRDDEIVLELGEGVQVHAVRSTIMHIRSKSDDTKSN